VGAKWGPANPHKNHIKNKGRVMDEPISVTIKGWAKYNKRKDIKQPLWFALSNRLLEDSDIFSLSAEELKSWIYLLCQASQKNKSTFQISLEHAQRVCGVSPKALKSAISKLAHSDVLIVTYAPRTDLYAPRTDAFVKRTAQYNTIHNNTEHNIAQNSLSDSVFDFEKIYARFPRKVGKQRGINALKRSIKNAEDYSSLDKALDHYIAYCKANATEHRFIKHFSSWVSEWRDWLDSSTGISEDFSSNKQPLISQEEWDEMLRSKNVST